MTGVSLRLEHLQLVVDDGECKVNENAGNGNHFENYDRKPVPERISEETVIQDNAHCVKEERTREKANKNARKEEQCENHFPIRKFFAGRLISRGAYDGCAFLK